MNQGREGDQGCIVLVKVTQSHWEAGDTDRFQPQLSSSGVKEQECLQPHIHQLLVNSCLQGWECLNPQSFYLSKPGFSSRRGAALNRGVMCWLMAVILIVFQEPVCTDRDKRERKPGQSVHQEIPVSIRNYYTWQQGSSYELRLDLSHYYLVFM